MGRLHRPESNTEAIKRHGREISYKLVGATYWVIAEKLTEERAQAFAVEKGISFDRPLPPAAIRRRTRRCPGRSALRARQAGAWVHPREPKRTQPRRTQPDRVVGAPAVTRQRPQGRVSTPSRQPDRLVLCRRPPPFQRLSRHSAILTAHKELRGKAPHYGRRETIRHPGGFP